MLINSRKDCMKNTILKYLIIVYPLLIVFENTIPFLSTIMTLLFLIVLVLDNFLYARRWGKYGLILTLFTISTLLSTETENHSLHIKVLLIFFLSFESYYHKLYDKVIELINRYQKVLLIELWGGLVVNFLLACLPYGYSQKYSEDWGVKAFQGIFADPHQAAYRIAALLTILLFIAHFNYQKNQYLLVGGYALLALMTGARTPALIVVVIVLLFCVQNRFIIKGTSKRETKFLSIFPFLVGGLFCLYIALFFTSFGDKILNSAQSSSFDNGRTEMREVDILMFSTSDLEHKLFGHGTDAVLQFHAQHSWTGTAIWSHNDFMQILCGMGLIMLLIYSMSWIDILKDVIGVQHKIYFLVCWGILVSVAFLNGMYIHSRFVFICPLLFKYIKIVSVERECI